MKTIGLKIKLIQLVRTIPISINKVFNSNALDLHYYLIKYYHYVTSNIILLNLKKLL